MSETHLYSPFRAQQKLHQAAQAKVVGVLLAAGSSCRFGANKLVQMMPNGEMLAIRSLRNLKGAVDAVIAVVRPGQEVLASALRDEGAKVFVFGRADEGMGASLAYAISMSESADGWVVALADMPLIKTSTISSISMRLRLGSSIVVPRFRGKRGHPVGFCSRWRRELLSLAGDSGARSILNNNWEEISILEVGDPGVCFDVDLPEIFDRIKGKVGATRQIPRALHQKNEVGAQPIRSWPLEMA